MVRAIYTYHFFAYTDTLSSGGKYKVVVIAVFLSKLDHRPLFHEKTILVYGLVSVCLTNTTHCPIVFTMLVEILYV